MSDTPTNNTDWTSLHGESFRNRRVLVTGGAGFIGSHTVRALCSLGASVVVLDDLSGGFWDNLNGLNVEKIESTILDQPVLDRCCKGCQYVFHLAARGSVPQSIENPRLYHEINTTGTLNVLEAARQTGVRRVVFSASSSAYGNNPTLPKTESMVPLPISPYAAGKVAAECLLAAWSAAYGIDTVSLRYFNIFGPRQNAGSAYAAVVAAFATAVLNGKRPIIYGDGEHSRDFTYVDNAVHANLLAAKNPMPLAGAVINIACGRRISINQLASLVTQLANRADLEPVFHEERHGDVRHSVADLTRAKTLIHYEPIVDFAAGLRRTLDWYRS